MTVDHLEQVLWWHQAHSFVRGKWGNELTCAQSALKLYVDAERESWPAAFVSPLDHRRVAHIEAVRSGDYGRCVWRCDNDVVDHQVVALEQEGGATATITMSGFTAVGGRRTRVHSIEGVAEFSEHGIEVRRYAQGAVDHIDIEDEAGSHGVSDRRLADA